MAHLNIIDLAKQIIKIRDKQDNKLEKFSNFAA